MGAPAVLGREERDRITRYATFLPRFLEAAYPTRVLAERLAQRNVAALAPAVRVLQRTPSFDFSTMRVHEFVRDHPDTLAGEADPVGTRRQLEAMQRLWDIAPAFEKHRTVALIAEGIDSATAIRRIGAAALLERYSSALGSEAEAAQVYANAALKSRPRPALTHSADARILDPSLL